MGPDIGWADIRLGWLRDSILHLGRGPSVVHFPAPRSYSSMQEGDIERWKQYKKDGPFALAFASLFSPVQNGCTPQSLCSCSIFDPLCMRCKDPHQVQNNRELLPVFMTEPSWPGPQLLARGLPSLIVLGFANYYTSQGCGRVHFIFQRGQGQQSAHSANTGVRKL